MTGITIAVLGDTLAVDVTGPTITDSTGFAWLPVVVNGRAGYTAENNVHAPQNGSTATTVGSSPPLVAAATIDRKVPTATAAFPPPQTPTALSQPTDTPTSPPATAASQPTETPAPPPTAVPTAAPQPVQAASATWKDPQGRLSLAYPGAWKSIPPVDQGEIFEIDSGDGVHFSVYASPRKSDDTPMSGITSYRTRQNQRTDRAYSFGPATQTNVGDQAAAAMSFQSSSRTNPSDVHIANVTYVGSGAWMLAFEAYTDGTSWRHQDQVQGILQSVTFPLGTTSAAPASGPIIISDPFAYCARVGTASFSDRTQGQVRYSGPDFPFGNAPSGAAVVWRCRNGQTLACQPFQGFRELKCGKPDFSRTPSQAMTDTCKTTGSSAPFISQAVLKNTAYDWDCRNGRPVIVGQEVYPNQVDDLGYILSDWYTPSR